MTYPFVLTVPAQLGQADPLTWNFDVARFSDGFPQVDTVYEPSLLQAASVNMSRMRLNRFDYPSFTVEAILATDTFDTAVGTARLLRAMRGFYCNFSVVMQGVTYDYSSYTFYILDVAAVPNPGVVVGGAVSEANGSMVARLTLKATA